MTEILDLGFGGLIAAYFFVLILYGILKLRGIKKENEILISSLRMTLQLTLAGYILTYIFRIENVVLNLLVIFIMEAFAIQNIFKRTNIKDKRKLKKSVSIGMLIGTFASLFFFFGIVIRLEPWYKAQYLIPIAGMIIGNSMTGISLGVFKLKDDIKNQQQLIEGALMLGATPKMAVKDIVNKAFEAAILPTINSMVGMGIIFLPGMMTGQILSGISPLIAIKYQIVILLGILGSVSLTVIVFLSLGYKTFFNSRSQLIL